MPAHILEFFLKLCKAAPNISPVSLNLGLTRTTKTDATGRTACASARLSCQVSPHTRQAWQTIFILSQLYLQLAFVGLGVLGENVKDECSAVHYFAVEDSFQLTLLARRQLIVEEKNIQVEFIPVFL